MLKTDAERTTYDPDRLANALLSHAGRLEKAQTIEDVQKTALRLKQDVDAAKYRGTRQR